MVVLTSRFLTGVMVENTRCDILGSATGSGGFARMLAAFRIGCPVNP